MIELQRGVKLEKKGVVQFRTVIVHNRTAERIAVIKVFSIFAVQNKNPVDKRILLFIIVGIVLNTVGMMIMLFAQMMLIALPVLALGLVFTLLAVLKSLKGDKKSDSV